MKLVLLGYPGATNGWKDCLADAAAALGWHVTHLPARDIPADDVVRLCREADALIWMRTHGANPTGDVAGMLRRIEDAGTATVGLHLDLYWGIPRRERQIGRHPWWTCQHVFTADGGPRPWGQRGVNHWWCPPAMGARFFGRGMPAARYLCRAVFVGSYAPGTHGPHRAHLLAWARCRWRDGFARYGHRSRRVWGRNLNALYASAGVVLGDSAPAAGYWSDRVPTVLGRGGLLAHPDTVGMAGLGFDAQTMVPYTRYDFAGLGERLEALSGADRARITDNALTVIAERHMWTHRLRDIQRVVFGAGGCRVRGQSTQVGASAAESSGAVA